MAYRAHIHEEQKLAQQNASLNAIANAAIAHGARCDGFNAARGVRVGVSDPDIDLRGGFDAAKLQGLYPATLEGQSNDPMELQDRGSDAVQLKEPISVPSNEAAATTSHVLDASTIVGWILGQLAAQDQYGVPPRITVNPRKAAH